MFDTRRLRCPIMIIIMIIIILDTWRGLSAGETTGVLAFLDLDFCMAYKKQNEEKTQRLAVDVC
jgi:hypothetical protein